MTSVLPSAYSPQHGLSPVHGKFPRFADDWLDRYNWDNTSEYPTHHYSSSGYDSRLLSDWSIRRSLDFTSSNNSDQVREPEKNSNDTDEGNMEETLHGKNGHTPLSNVEVEMNMDDSDEEIKEIEHPEPERFKLSLRLGSGNAKPEDVNIEVNGHILAVSGKVTEEKDLNGIHTLRRKAFTHRFKLNELVNVDKLNSELHDDGVLVLQAPLIDLDNQSEKREPSPTDGRSS